MDRIVFTRTLYLQGHLNKIFYYTYIILKIINANTKDFNFSSK